MRNLLVIYNFAPDPFQTFLQFLTVQMEAQQRNKKVMRWRERKEETAHFYSETKESSALLKIDGVKGKFCTL
jgi:hypothetical protein